MVGEIFLAKIYFTDLKDFKIRPVLVIKEIEDDVICLAISTKFKEGRIIITNNDLEDGYLKVNSVVIVPKNFTLSKTILFKKIAKLKKEKFKEIVNIFCNEICN